MSATTVTTPPPPGSGIDPRAYAMRWKTLGVLALSLVIIGLDNTILNVALPSLQSAFDADNSTLQWMVDAYLLVFAGLLLTLGMAGDRWGRKRALQLGTLIFGGASLAVLAVDSSTGLIAVRATMGIGAALIMPATLSIVTNVFPREERGKAIAIWSAMAALGIGLGPLIGGALLEQFSWRSVFLVNVPITLIAFTLAARYVIESRDPSPGRLDLPGAALSMAGLVAFVYGIIEGPVAGWSSPEVLGAMGLGLALLAAFVAWERHTPDPMLELKFFRNPRFAIGAFGTALTFFALFGSIFMLTQFLQFALGYSALEAGAATAPITIGLILGAGSSQKLVKKLGTRRVMAAGALGVAAVLATVVAWSVDMPYWPIGFWLIALAMFMGWVMGPATEAVMGAVPPERAGVASAMSDVTRQVGGALGTAVVGSIVASMYGARMHDQVQGLPPDAAAGAEGSIGGAVAVAGQLPAGAAEQLQAAAASAFTEAFGAGLLVASTVALATAVIVARFMPARHLAHDDPRVVPSTLVTPVVAIAPAH